MTKRCPCGKSKRPSFGLPGGKPYTAKWCSKCPEKPDNAVDVRNKRCACGASYPSYGNPGGNPGSAKWCAKCPEKPADSVNVHSKRCVCGKSQPSLGLPGEHPYEARWCAKCPDKPVNALNVVRKRPASAAVSASPQQAPETMASPNAALASVARHNSPAGVPWLPENAESIMSVVVTEFQDRMQQATGSGAGVYGLGGTVVHKRQKN